MVSYVLSSVVEVACCGII